MLFWGQNNITRKNIHIFEEKIKIVFLILKPYKYKWQWSKSHHLAMKNTSDVN